MQKKILIVRFSSIGDIVLTTPIIRCIKQQLNAEIHYVTKKAFATILESNPYIDKVFVIEKKTTEVLSALNKEDYDYIVDLHNNLRSFQLKFALAKPAFVFHKLNFKKWLLVRFKLNILPKTHIVDRYFDCVKPLGIINDGKGLDYFIPTQNQIDLSSLPISHQKGYVGFVIGAKHFTKQLPVEKIISICKKINFPIVLLGGPEDKSNGEIIKTSVGNIVFNACGIYTLHQSAFLVKNATKIITHDTGLMHIAAAFKKEIVSVWGNTVPDFGMYPYLPDPKSIIAEVKGLSCRPCSKIGYKQCPKGHFNCMNLQNEVAISTQN